MLAEKEKPMDPDSVAPMIVMVTAILTTGGVLIFRPIAKRLGALLEVMTQQRMRPAPTAELAHIRDLLGNIDGRLNQIEERQDFAEALLSTGEPPLLNVPARVRGAERH
jgi:hypothetical protein